MSDATPRIRIVGGGEPDGPEHAAIVAAVTQLLEAHEETPIRPRSAWSLAGRLEGVGMTTVRARSGLPR